MSRNEKSTNHQLPCLPPTANHPSSSEKALCQKCKDEDERNGSIKVEATSFKVVIGSEAIGKSAIALSILVIATICLEFLLS